MYTRSPKKMYARTAKVVRMPSSGGRLFSAARAGSTGLSGAGPGPGAVELVIVPRSLLLTISAHGREESTGAGGGTVFCWWACVLFPVGNKW